MMDWTDRHCRFFLRQVNAGARLYTEMIPTGAILFGDADRFLSVYNAYALAQDVTLQRLYLETMEEILTHTGGTRSNRPAQLFLTDVDRYYRAIIPPLQVRDLEDMQKLRTSWKPPCEACPSYPSLDLLGDLSAVLDAVCRYWEQKFADIYLEPMQCLTYEDFHSVQTSLRRFEAAFEEMYVREMPVLVALATYVSPQIIYCSGGPGSQNR